MADQLQLRGGTTAENDAFTGVSREVTIDTEKNTVVVHDGFTEGGHPLLREADTATLLARANHTGTQTMSTISDAGTAATQDITETATDTTAGRLLKVGDNVERVVDTISDLLGTSEQTVKSVRVLNYHSGLEGGGGVFYWDATKAKSEHNGGTVIDPTVGFPTDWDNQTQLGTWFDTSNAGTGCWVRQSSDDSAVNVKWFGAKGDGVVDDTVAAFKAAAEANLNKISGYISAGEYILDTDVPLFFEYGLKGDGSSVTKIQGVNNGTVRPSLLHIGSGENGGFTVDGACSDDPVTWDSTNFDSFTGHSRTVRILRNNSVIRDIVSQNSVRAPIHCELRKNVVFKNCAAIRGRGNFGDAWYIQRSSSIKLENCTGYDYTRIGFVCEGNVGRVTDGVTFVNCIAEYGHDQGINYGGTEFNSGFWSENATNIVHINCKAINNTDRGFTYAGTSAVTNLDENSTNTASYTNCTAQDNGVGFTCGSLGALGATKTVVSHNNCSGIDNREHFRCTKASAVYTLCNAKTTIGADSTQNRVFTVGDNANITIDGFLEEWEDKGVNYYSTASDTGSISKFSTAGPQSIKISNYKTTDGFKAILKLRANSANGTICDINIDNSDIALGIIVSARIAVHNSQLSILNGGPRPEELTVTDSNVLAESKSTFQTLKALFRGCKIERTFDNYVFFYNTYAERGPRILFEDCDFICDVNDGPMLRFNSETSLASLGTSLFSVFKTCRFIHTGVAAPSVSYVQHNRSSAVSKVHLYDCFTDGDFTFTRMSADSRIIALP